MGITDELRAWAKEHLSRSSILAIAATLSDSDATRERQGVAGTCKADETDMVECVCDGIGHYGESLTVHVMECSACGGTYEYVNGSYEYCPRCGAKVVNE